MKNHYSHFQNRECEFYPCHEADGENFNCLFCFCPLYMLGSGCGGNFTYTEDGVKDCSKCTIPHLEGGYEHIISRCPEIAEKIKEGNLK